MRIGATRSVADATFGWNHPIGTVPSSSHCQPMDVVRSLPSNKYISGEDSKILFCTRLGHYRIITAYQCILGGKLFIWHLLHCAGP